MPDRNSPDYFRPREEFDVSRRQAQKTRLQLLLKGVDLRARRRSPGSGLHTVGDLLRHYPRRWEDRTHFVRAGDVRPGEWVTVCGTCRGQRRSIPRVRGWR